MLFMKSVDERFIYLFFFSEEMPNPCLFLKKKKKCLLLIILEMPVTAAAAGILKNIFLFFEKMISVEKMRL